MERSGLLFLSSSTIEKSCETENPFRFVPLLINLDVFGWRKVIGRDVDSLKVESGPQSCCVGFKIENLDFVCFFTHRKPSFIIPEI